MSDIRTDSAALSAVAGMPRGQFCVVQRPSVGGEEPELMMLVDGKRYRISVGDWSNAIAHCGMIVPLKE